MDIQPNQANPSSTVPGAFHAFGDKLTLRELLELASQLYVARPGASRSDLDKLLPQIRRRGEEELEIGDGMKIENVRAERKLDGTVAIFFGF